MHSRRIKIGTGKRNNANIENMTLKLTKELIG